MTTSNSLQNLLLTIRNAESRSNLLTFDQKKEIVATVKLSIEKGSDDLFRAYINYNNKIIALIDISQIEAIEIADKLGIKITDENEY